MAVPSSPIGAWPTRSPGGTPRCTSSPPRFTSLTATSITSAGTASAIDACLHIVRSHLGSAAAATIARNLVVAPHREGDQAQYVDRPMPQPGGVGHVGPTIDWALANLDQPLTVDELANHARMSRRNLARRFGEVTGTTPARWVLARRLDEA